MGYEDDMYKEELGRDVFVPFVYSRTVEPTASPKHGESELVVRAASHLRVKDEQ